MNVRKFYANFIHRSAVTTYMYCMAYKWHFYVKIFPVWRCSSGIETCRRYNKQ